MNSTDTSTPECIDQFFSHILEAYYSRSSSASRPPLPQTSLPPPHPQIPLPSKLIPNSPRSSTRSPLITLPILTSPLPLIILSRSPSPLPRRLSSSRLSIPTSSLPLILLSKSPSTLLITPPLPRQPSSSPTLPILTRPLSLLEKNSIRFIPNDQNNYREKYTGDYWQLVCTWNYNECNNFASFNTLCKKHNIQRLDESITITSLPSYSLVSDNNILRFSNFMRIIVESNTEVSQNKTIVDHTNKSEYSHFKLFSIESDDDDDIKIHDVQSVLEILSNPQLNPSVDSEYTNSKYPPLESQIIELLSKNIPPLTCFEEVYLGNLLMQNYSRICSMLDAQLYLHDQAIQIMNTISSEYFYDFLLRRPQLAIHYKYWFSQYDRILPTTNCSIDNKIQTLVTLTRST